MNKIHEDDEINFVERAEDKQQPEGIDNRNTDVDSFTLKPSGGKYRMVALDLDGTLLGSDHQISDTSKDYLTYLHSKGFVVSFATGRGASCTFDHVSRLNFDFPRSSLGLPVVCSNGAQGLHISNDLVKTELFYEPVPNEVTLKVIKFALNLGHVTQYYHENDIYVHTNNETHVNLTNRYSQLTGSKQVFCCEKYDLALSKGLPSKLLILCGEDNVDSVVRAVKENVGGDAHVLRGSPAFFVEVLHKNVCKGNGLRNMSKSLGIDMSEIIAFGDGDNDVEFIQYAGHGIAMKNARDTLKKVADEECEWTNAENGVVLKLKQMEKEGLLYFPNEN
eukprot:CAMPEP_0195530724 /NCGR_PEP_ID=MMETSP0794_2-20130614/33747_1 /TAXON_ID=515487 /ORGANISM="Stephanopyxis turris, Strain CCMP 815" /LENGTH=333 /DNA_ID=CAMNT_0040662295 /DNA_START=24 /DNA_END=1025 /DNA_ORIENTATION=+